MSDLVATLVSLAAGAVSGVVVWKIAGKLDDRHSS